MKSIVTTSITIAILLVTGLFTLAQAESSSIAAVEAAVSRRVNQARSQVWAELDARGYDAASVREQGDPQTVAAMDRGLWPLVAVPELVELGANLNQRCLAAGQFALLEDAMADPRRAVVREGGYPALKTGVRYAVIGYQRMVDAESVALGLLKGMIDRDIALLAAGEPNVLFDQSLKEVGVSLSGSQEFINGRAFYSYVLTVIAARPENAPSLSYDGINEGDESLLAKTLFDPQYYLMLNPDLAGTIGNDRQALCSHWLHFGIAEGRTGSLVFNARYYLQVNPDLGAVFGADYRSAMLHWLAYGINEGRSATPDFNPIAYLVNNPDLSAAFADDYQAATWHYLVLGFDEGR